MCAEGRAILSIGEFASLVGMSAKTLRRYSDAGLLEPARVDSTTGYRWYAETQAGDAILAVLLRRLNMPIFGVKEVLALSEVEARWRAVASFWSDQRQQVAERERLLERVRDTIVGADADRVFQPSDLDALPDRVRTQILASMAPVSLPPGVPLFSQGDQPDAMYVIESGSARVLMTFPETETPIEVGLLGPGQLFGELGVLDGTPRVAAVVSAEEATFLRLDAQTFDELRDAFPELEAVLRAVAAAR